MNINLIKRPQLLAEQTQELLLDRGISIGFTTYDTDYGQSVYIYLYIADRKCKIRISDHSVTNRYRMADEVHINPDYFDPQRLANMIELILHPERFVFVESNTKKTHIIDGKFGYYSRI